MSDEDDARGLYRETFRIQPLKWFFFLAVFGTILADALIAASGFRHWFGLASVAAIVVLMPLMLWRRRRFLRRATPRELRRRSIRELKSRTAYATLTLVVALFIIGIMLLMFLVDWIRGESPSSTPVGRIAALQLLLSVFFLYTYFVDMPRYRRILESLPPEDGQAPQPVA